MPRLLVFSLVLVFLPGLRAAAPAPKPTAPAPGYALREMDRAWVRMQQRAPTLGVRELYSFVLTAAERGWHPETLPQVLDLAASMQDTNPASPTYGNYRWYYRDPKPDDRNAVEFSMQTASLTWLLYRDRLVPEAREKLAAAMRLGIEGMLRHKVDVSYTNIFLMRIANCILIGESTDRPDILARGRQWFDEWLVYTRTHGIHEFDSPTYYGVDLTDLGAIAQHTRDPDLRDKATRALRLFWTDIAAHWFEPFQGIAGAYSRDYGFLTGHGDLDEHLERAGWMPVPAAPKTRPTLEDVTQWDPPANIKAERETFPRDVRARWGAEAWEQSTIHIERNFALGSSGAGYGQQDKILALTLAGGPQQPIVNFSLDYRNDPYGQAKVVTSGGHLKLTHLVPFVTSIQRGGEALLYANFDPHAKNSPKDIESVVSNLVLPDGVEFWTQQGLLSAATGTDNIGNIELDQGVLFFRFHDTVAAVRFVLATDEHDHAVAIALRRDGAAYHAARIAAVNALHAPDRPVATAIWIRAAEASNDEAFARFRRDFLRDSNGAKVSAAGDRQTIAVPGVAGELRLSFDIRKNARLAMAGGDPRLQTGILNINGRDAGGEILP